MNQMKETISSSSASASLSTAIETIDSGCSTPYMTAPSSPPRFNSDCFFSQFGHNPSLKDANFTLPSPSPSSSSSSPKQDHNPIDFAFHFTNIFHDTPLSAEDLFHHGKIKPLKSSSSQLEADQYSETEENVNDGVVFKTANSSPRRKRKDIDFAPSSDDDELRINRRSPAKRELHKLINTETTSFNNSLAFEHAKAKPFQLSQMLFDADEGDDQELAKQSKNVKTLPKTASATSFWTSFSLTKAYRKWKLKDLLFRSASEGRSTDKVAVDPALMNYAILTKSKSRETAASFRSSSDGSSSMKGSGSGSGRRRTGSSGAPVSAHELHYTENRAVSEEMKRKTFLPYKQSLLGCLGFNPGGHHFPGRVGSIARV